MSGKETRPKRRWVISATCTVHPGTPSYTNLELTWDGEQLCVRPHADGACVLRLTEAEAAELYAVLGEAL